MSSVSCAAAVPRSSHTPGISMCWRKVPCAKGKSAAGNALATERAELALQAARAAIEASPLRLQAGATQSHPQVIVLRVLTPVVEPAMQLLRPVWAAWRQALWDLPGTMPRLWNL